MNASILRIALPTPLRRLFEYVAPDGVDPLKLIPGIRVSVPFQSRTLVGILIEVVEDTTIPAHKLKKALAILDEEAYLTSDLFALCQWASKYYHYALGEIFATALPALLRKAKSLPPLPPLKKSNKKIETLPLLNEDQLNAVNRIQEKLNQFEVYLLDGVTGSGKTEVYLRCIESVLQIGKQVLVLVPEINLTPQTIDRFNARFICPIVVLHSNLSEKKRLEAWLYAKTGEARIIIGTRSAIFTPFNQLGLIIVDEEHDTSFKQQDRFRYHARDIAVVRARSNQIPIILGSATPSLESLININRKRYTYLKLKERAGSATLPQIELLNIESCRLQEGLSPPLLGLMKQHLEANNQVLLFLNRRGFAPVLYCKHCAWMATCKHCATRLVYHQAPLRLQCHQCDLKKSIPSHCEQCGQSDLEPIGLGTQRLENKLKNDFPDIPLIRIDRDSTSRRHAMTHLLKEIETHPRAILLGTQMIAKGHHFPNITLVGVVDADSGLLSRDYRASEQMGQLLLQVAGRAGREAKKGTVIIQTRQPTHQLLQSLVNHGYGHFSKLLLQERQQTMMPPYSSIAVFRAEAPLEEAAQAFLEKIKSHCSLFNEVSIFGPVPALLSKRRGLYCQQLIVKAKKRSILQSFLNNLIPKIDLFSIGHSVKWILDVDPIEI